ncbi:MAG: hypothetical protein ACRDJN_00015, partial [Chloroflexota bacterium]
MSWLAKLGAIAAALLGALVGVIVVFPFGLVVAEVVIFPLALGVAAVLATVGAGLAGTVLANDGTRTRLKPVLAVAEATAAVLAVLLLAYLA